MEDYEKKYKELVGKIDKAYLYAQTDSTKAVLEEIRPELKDSRNEKIRKTLSAYFSRFKPNDKWDDDFLFGDIVAWLEKQGEQKYEEAIERAKTIDKREYGDIISTIFPEFKESNESEDEKSKKWILEYLYDGLQKSDEQFKDHFKAAIAWLEKQGESKSYS